MIRLSDRLRAAAAELAEAGVESARADAELIVAHVLGVSRGRLVIVDSITESDAARISELVRARARRIPLQHLTGVAPFFGRELAVGPGVFIPRPETELLAQWGIEVIKGVAQPVVVDLCSGSGALAVAVAHDRPDATVYAVERSRTVLEWLHRNVSGTGVQVVEGDVRVVGMPSGVDLVLCNPPYVPEAIPVPPEVDFDPHEAVFAGDDGLELIPTVIRRAAQALRPGGWLGFEHDETHSVADLLAADFEQVETHRDLAGRPRYTTASRRKWQTGTL